MDTTSTEYKKHIKQEKELYEKAKKKSEEKKLKKSIFGTNTSAYNFKGYNYESYEDGKYSEVAKAENWSKWALPSDMDARLEAYERGKRVRLLLMVFSSIVLIGGVILFLRKRGNV